MMKWKKKEQKESIQNFKIAIFFEPSGEKE